MDVPCQTHNNDNVNPPRGTPKNLRRLSVPFVVSSLMSYELHQEKAIDAKSEGDSDPK